MRYLLLVLLLFGVYAQQTVNNFVVKTNLTVAGVPVTLSVNNIQGLLALNPELNNVQVSVAGYYSPGDGGGGTYFITNTVSGTNAYGGRFAALGGVKSWQLIDETISAKQFGAKGDGITDDLSSLQAANDWMTNSFQKELFIPAGTYLVRSNWNIGDFEYYRPVITIRGETIGSSAKQVAEMSTQIKLKDGANTDVAIVDSGKVAKIIGVGFNGNRDNQTSTNLAGLRLKGSSGLSFNEMEIVECSFQLVNGYGFYSDRSEFKLIYCGSFFNLFGIFIEKGVSTGISDPLFDWVLCGLNTYDGVCLTDVGSGRFSNIDSYMNGRHGFALTNCYYIRWNSCQANDNYGSGMVLAGQQNRHVFQSCWFNQNNHDQFTGFSKPYGDPPAYSSGTWSNFEVTGLYSNNNGHVFESCTFWNSEKSQTNKPAYSFNDTRSGVPAYGELLFFNNSSWPINFGTNIFYSVGVVPSGFFTSSTTLGGVRGGGTQASSIRQQLNVLGQEGAEASSSLNIRDTSSQIGVYHTHYGGAATNNLKWVTYALNNTISSPQALSSGNIAWQHTVFSYDGSAIANLADFSVLAAENTTPTAKGGRYLLKLVRTNTVSLSSIVDLQGHAGSIFIDNFAFGKSSIPSTNYGIQYVGSIDGNSANRAGLLVQPTLSASSNDSHGLLIRNVINGANDFVSGVYSRDPYTNSGGSIKSLVHFWAGTQTNTTATNTATLALGSYPTDGNWFLYNTTKANSKINGGIQFGEITDQPAPSSDAGILYVRDNGSGKSQLVIRFPSGAVQVIATEP